MYFLELEMTATGFGLVHTFRVSVYVVCVSPPYFFSLTNKVDHQFWLVLSTILQSPIFYHSSISIFDSRQQNILSLLFKIKWQSRPRSRLKLVKIVDHTSNVYFIVVCPENAINDTGTAPNWIPGTDNLCTYKAPAWFPFFLNFFEPEFCIRVILWLWHV